jgi:DNA-binding GntR family transcriptional regulator
MGDRRGAKWRQVQGLVLSYISANKLPEGAPLPSDKEFARMAECSLQPVVRAMEELARQGLVRRRPGAATTVWSQVPLIDQHEFSFTYGATHAYGHSLRTRVIELACRLPAVGEARAFERRAQKALGLRVAEPFLVVARLRYLNDQPRVLHRSYLSPDNFLPTFLSDHEFEKESLIDIYVAAGFRIEARRTTLMACFPNPEVAGLLRCANCPILQAEGELEAVRVATGERNTLEYLEASYLNWEYHIGNRRPPSS